MQHELGIGRIFIANQCLGQNGRNGIEKFKVQLNRIIFELSLVNAKLVCYIYYSIVYRNSVQQAKRELLFPNSLTNEGEAFSNSLTNEKVDISKQSYQ